MRIRIQILSLFVGLVFLAAAPGLSSAQDRDPQLQATPAATETAQNGQPSGVTTGDRPVLKKRNPRYQLRSGDVLDLTFSFTPEFNQSVVIQPDGYISLRELGDVHVQGLTLPEVMETIRVAYSRILHDPAVSVFLKDFEKPYFIAAGWLKSPGKYELRGDTTVAEAVSIAGGFTDASKHSEIYVFRRSGDGDNWVAISRLNMKRMLKNADLTEDTHLQPGDLVYVPQNTLSKIKDLVIPKITVGARAPF
jgi:polysaccharide export outer membrane protein